MNLLNKLLSKFKDARLGFITHHQKFLHITNSLLFNVSSYILEGCFISRGVRW